MGSFRYFRGLRDIIHNTYATELVGVPNAFSLGASVVALLGRRRSRPDSAACRNCRAHIGNLELAHDDGPV